MSAISIAVRSSTRPAKNQAARTLCSIRRSRCGGDHEGWRTDLLQDWGSNLPPANRLSSWLALCADDWDTQMIAFRRQGIRVSPPRPPRPRTLEPDRRTATTWIITRPDAAAVVETLPPQCHPYRTFTGGGEAVRYVARTRPRSRDQARTDQRAVPPLMLKTEAILAAADRRAPMACAGSSPPTGAVLLRFRERSVLRYNRPGATGHQR